MQADEDSKDKTSLNLKCYKRLLTPSSIAKTWQFPLFSQSLNSRGKKNMYLFPKPFTWP